MAGHMAPKHQKSDGQVGELRRSGDDAFKLTVDYLKQEALDPLKGLGRFLLWGLTGSLAIAVGILLVLVGILRLLQTETGTALTGDWSWVPYFVVAVLGIGVAAVAGWRITAGPGQRRQPGRQGRNQLMARTAGKGGRITREDLQAAYAQVLGEGEATVRAAAPQALAVGGAIGVVVVTLAFLAGRRRGRSRSAVVEIRRL